MNDYFQFPKTPPAYAFIWLHGLGASGADMRSIAEVMDLDGLFARHVFLDAPERPVTINQGMVMPAWYDIVGTTLTDREDEVGIVASRGIIDSEIDVLLKSGYQSHQIILIGFSQGAAMALHAGLHSPVALGGIVALSGYLPLVSTLKPTLPSTTPFFIGYGRYDPIVMPAWSQHSLEVLKKMGYSKVAIEGYPMEHRVCPEEITALSNWVKAL